MPKLDELYYEVTVRGAQQAQQRVAAVSQSMQRLGSVAAGLTGRLAGLGGALTSLLPVASAGGPFGMIAASAAAAVVAVGTLTARLAAAREQMQLRLGRLGLDESVVRDLRQFAPADELARAMMTLRGAGMGVEDVNATMRRLVALSLAGGQSVSQLADALAKAGQAGRVTHQDIQAFGAVAPEIYAELARQLGVSVERVRELGAEGQITYAQLADALRALTDEQGRFGAVLHEQANTLSGQWATFVDQLRQIGETLGQYVLPYLTMVLQAFNVLLGTALPQFDAPSRRAPAPRPPERPPRPFGDVPAVAPRERPTTPRSDLVTGVFGLAEFSRTMQQRAAADPVRILERQAVALDQLVGLAAGGGIAVLIRGGALPARFA